MVAHIINSISLHWRKIMKNANLLPKLIDNSTYIVIQIAAIPMKSRKCGETCNILKQNKKKVEGLHVSNVN